MTFRLAPAPGSQTKHQRNAMSMTTLGPQATRSLSWTLCFSDVLSGPRPGELLLLELLHVEYCQNIYHAFGRSRISSINGSSLIDSIRTTTITKYRHL